jgi:alkylation response protein AidB-like acyl-CoA dehydrogenase
MLRGMFNVAPSRLTFFGERRDHAAMTHVIDLNHDDLAAARRIGELAAEHAPESDKARQLAAPVVAAIEGSGFNALLMPSAMGGRAASPRDAVVAIEEIATRDASAAWCASISMGSNHLAGIIPEKTARDVFTDLNRGGAGPFNPGALALPDDDGVHVNGRWGYASNCNNAAVSACGVILTENGQPKITENGIEMALAFLTEDQFTIEPTWNTAGLTSTGSHDIVGNAVLAPELIATLYADKWPDDALFRLRSFDVLGPGLAAVPLGIGRAALDVVAHRAQRDAETPPKPGPKPRLADNPWHQLEFGRAEIRLRAARAVLLEATDQALAYAARGDEPPRVTTAVIGIACSEALAAAKHAVETAVTLVGTDAVREGSPLLRLRRDIDAAGSHVMFSPMIVSNLSKELAGIPTAAYPFLPAP